MHAPDDMMAVDSNPSPAHSRCTCYLRELHEFIPIQESNCRDILTRDI